MNSHRARKLGGYGKGEREKKGGREKQERTRTTEKIKIVVSFNEYVHRHISVYLY